MSDTIRSLVDRNAIYRRNKPTSDGKPSPFRLGSKPAFIQHKAKRRLREREGIELPAVRIEGVDPIVPERKNDT